MLNTKEFWAATGQRVVRSFAAAMIAILTVSQTDVLSADWVGALSTAGMAAVITLLLCLAGGSTDGNGPAFGRVETLDN